MSVTFAVFTRPSHFHELSQGLSAVTKCRQAAFKSPKSFMLYTKLSTKANPRGRGTAM
jgi:hypothetical protein